MSAKLTLTMRFICPQIFDRYTEIAKYVIYAEFLALLIIFYSMFNEFYPVPLIKPFLN